MTGQLAREIKQTKSFSSLEEEAILNLQRTAALVDQVLAGTFKPYGISDTQYNALRILRGAGEQGLACQELAQRMITRDPDITRLLDRLESRKLIERSRSRDDRRVVLTRISEAGLKLLASMDSDVKEVPGKVLGHLGEKRLRSLIHLLELSRNAPRR
jgi:DNA-binding MarR family transcriptional regulator